MAGDPINVCFAAARKKGGYKLIRASEVKPWVWLRCGIAALDEITGGCLGHYRVLWGAEGACKSTTTALYIAAAQRAYPDKLVLLVDSENKFKPEWYAALGVDLDRLLILRNIGQNEGYLGCMEEYFDAIIEQVALEQIVYVVIDSISAMTPKDMLISGKDKVRSVEENQVAADAKKIQQFIKMTTELFGRTQAACDLIMHVRTQGIGGSMTWDGFPGGHHVKHMAVQIVHLARLGKGTWEKETIKVDGRDYELPKSFPMSYTLDKDSGPNFGRRAFAKFVIGVGFDDFVATLRAAQRHGLIKNPASGSFIVADDKDKEQKIRGWEKVETFYRENPLAFEKLKTAIFGKHYEAAVVTGADVEAESKVEVEDQKIEEELSDAA